MQVFIENESGSNKKNLFDEKNLKFRKSVDVSAKYPYPYGFVLNTTADDGDNLDCFVITDKVLKTGQIIECEPIGLMEQFETSWDPEKKGIEEKDHNVLAVLKGETTEISEEVEGKLTDFVENVFKHIPNKKVRVGKFLGKEEALRLIRQT